MGRLSDAFLRGYTAEMQSERIEQDEQEFQMRRMEALDRIASRKLSIRPQTLADALAHDNGNVGLDAIADVMAHDKAIGEELLQQRGLLARQAADREWEKQKEAIQLQNQMAELEKEHRYRLQEQEAGRVSEANVAEGIKAARGEPASLTGSQPAGFASSVVSAAGAEHRDITPSPPRAMSQTQRKALHNMIRDNIADKFFGASYALLSRDFVKYRGTAAEILGDERYQGLEWKDVSGRINDAAAELSERVVNGEITDFEAPYHAEEYLRLETTGDVRTGWRDVQAELAPAPGQGESNVAVDDPDAAVLRRAGLEDTPENRERVRAARAKRQAQNAGR